MKNAKSSQVIAKQPWTRQSAISLGEWLVNYGQTNKLPMAISVILDNQRVFQFALEGTSAENDLWIERKRRTVELTQLSSLEYREAILQNGVSDPDLPMTDGVMAFCGGGYPLFDATGYRGVAIVSGLPHLQDDEVVAKAVETFALRGGAGN
jgi:uncharacterized protein (UPF0303 family)